ncbi:MAG: hypothetical protein R3D03_04605 [Geminicoccaceae bacterium]
MSESRQAACRNRLPVSVSPSSRPSVQRISASLKPATRARHAHRTRAFEQRIEGLFGGDRGG